MVCAQFQPRHDVVTLIERLEAGNIRFVHFSYDNELRSRAFGTKLGKLENIVQIYKLYFLAFLNHHNLRFVTFHEIKNSRQV